MTPALYDLIIGLDRANKKADLCLLDPATGQRAYARREEPCGRGIPAGGPTPVAGQEPLWQSLRADSGAEDARSPDAPRDSIAGNHRAASGVRWIYHRFVRRASPRAASQTTGSSAE